MIKYKVAAGVGPIGLRKSPDSTHKLYGEWHTWNDGDVFSPPAHLKTIGGLTLEQCVAAGYLEEVDG